MHILATMAMTGFMASVAMVLDAGGAKPDPAPNLAGERMCPMIYQPVCGQSGSSKKTFPNRCQAEGAGYAVVSEGPCGEGSRRILKFGMSSHGTIEAMSEQAS